MTRSYLIIGDPITQVRSPEIYNARFAAAGIDATMRAQRVDPGELDTAMRDFKATASLSGLLVTVPFKAAAVRHVDDLLACGARVGAVNAIRRSREGRWVGDMFDGVGLVRAMEAASMGPLGKRILLLGAGGAGAAIADAVASAGARGIDIYDSDIPRAVRLARAVGGHHPGCVARAVEPALGGVDILINATPVGIHAGDGLPVELGPLPAAVDVVDIVPYPEVTPLLSAARRAGCRVLPGRRMIEGQVELILGFWGVG